MDFHESDAIFVRQVLDEALDSVFNKINVLQFSQKLATVNLSTLKATISKQEKDYISNRSKGNKNHELSPTSNTETEAIVNTERKSSLDLSFSRNILTHGDSNFPYLQTTVTLNNILRELNCNVTTHLYGLGEKSTSVGLQMSEELVNYINSNTLMTYLKNCFTDHPYAFSTAKKQIAYCHDQLYNPQIDDTSCNANNMTGHLEEKDPPTNSIVARIQHLSDNVTSKLNICISIPCSPTKLQNNNLNIMSPLASEGSTTISLLCKNLNNTHKLKLIESDDQSVCSAFTNEVPQSMFQTNIKSIIKSVTQMNNTYGDLCLTLSKPISRGLINQQQNQVVLSWDSSALQILNEITISSPTLDSMQSSNTKTVPVIEKYFEFDKSRRNDVFSNIGITSIEGSYGRNPQYLCENTLTITPVFKATSSSVPDICDTAWSSIPITHRRHSGDYSNADTTDHICADTKMTNDFDYKKLFHISNSSECEKIMHKECVGIPDNSFNGTHQDNVASNLPLLNIGNGSTCVTICESSDADELDNAIDDSLKLYEHFTMDVGVLATPSTAEKSCQTENYTESCKRCIEFDESQRGPAKKSKVNFSDELGFEYHSTNYSTIEDMHNITQKNNPYQNVTSGSYIPSPSATKRVQPGNFYFCLNDGDQSTNRPLKHFERFDYLKRDDDGLGEEERSLFADENITWRNESLKGSDQEVPTNAQANEGIRAPISFVTPKKPVLRVGLSRSARFNPLHPRF